MQSSPFNYNVTTFTTCFQFCFQNTVTLSLTNCNIKDNDITTHHHRHWRQQMSEWCEHMLQSYVVWCEQHHGPETRASHMTWSMNACREQWSHGFLRHLHSDHATQCCIDWRQMVLWCFAGQPSCSQSHLDKPLQQPHSICYYLLCLFKQKTCTKLLQKRPGMLWKTLS